MNRKYDAVIFDLDGTLLNTLDDLADAANATLAHFGEALRPVDDIRRFVGNGIRNLLRLIFPGGEDYPRFEEAFSFFNEYYGIHCMDKTKAYPGIMELLAQLKKDGYKTAIVSNKADFAVKKLNKLYFSGLIETAVGEREDVRRKPAPDSVLSALKELNISPQRAVYVGDSEVDVKTAENAQLPCIAVTWGFRSRETLLESGARILVSDACELREQL